MDYSLLLGIVMESNPVHDYDALMHNAFGGDALLGPMGEDGSPASSSGSGDMMAGMAGSTGGMVGSPARRYAPFYRHNGGCAPARVVQGPGAYYMGIIDILQYWNIGKRAELLAKTTTRCYCFGSKKHGLSCQPPRQYAER